MKSLFSRFRHKDKESAPTRASTATPGPSRRSSSNTINTAGPSNSHRQSVNHNDGSTSSSPATSPYPLPGIESHSHLSARPPIVTRRSSSATDQQSRSNSALGLSSLKAEFENHEDLDMRERTLSATYLDVIGAGGGKKVTFRSPIPTPPSSALMEDISPGPSTDIPQTSILSTPQTFSRNAANDKARPDTLRKHSLPPLTAVRPLHPSTSSTSYSTPSPSKSHTPQSSMTSPVPSTSASMASETSLAASTQSYLAQPNSWSEMAEEELIANLGPRERTRQEVLWEIVSSEERYVQELVKLNDTFCRALLPPSAQSPTLTLHDPLLALSRTLSPSSITSPSSPASQASPNLPIAARYSRSASSPHTQTPSDEAASTEAPNTTGASARLDAYNKLTNGRPTGPLRSKLSITSMRDKARAHQSLPPLSQGVSASRSGSSGSGVGTGKGWSGSFARLSHPTQKSGSGSGSTRIGSGSSLASIAQGQVPKEAVLPDELGQVLAVLSGGILEGHLKLAAALRKRYEDQYPLVRSLADVFTAHSYILREYATYILHLEAALGIIDSALSVATLPPPRRHSRQAELSTAEYTLGKALLNLEEIATERGESGLAISLSKPFQRLLKYPLLFQNLLFNTDPSLREYEATLAMVDEVEMIVRGIEDEKVGKEESERTRDVWARIEGLETDKGLMAPKSDRLLVGESQLSPSDTAAAEAGTKSRKSKHRLSDMLKKTEKVELWIIRFSDVSLLCEKTGVTQLPISSTKSKRESMPEMGGRRGSATVGRRSQSVRARNLYRFVRVHEWHLKPKSGSTDALLSMDDISRVRTNTQSASSLNKRVSSLSTPATPRKQPLPPSSSATHSRTPSGNPSSLAPSSIPLKTEDGPSPARTIRANRPLASDTDTMVSDRQSVMSFAFNGGDQVRPTRLRPKAAGLAVSTTPTGPRTTTTTPRPTSHLSRTTGGHFQGKAADAKFAHRLRSTEAPLATRDGESTLRTSSAARRSLPPAMMRSALNGAGSGDVAGNRPIALNPQALDRAHTPTAPLSPRYGVNGVTSRVVAGKKTGGVGAGEKAVERAGSISSRRTQPRVGKAAIPREGGTVRAATAARGGMI